MRISDWSSDVCSYDLRDKAARYGFTAQDLDNALYDAFGQRQISEYQTEVNQYQVILELSTAQRGNAESLSYFHLRSPLTGQMVPLLTFARKIGRAHV